MQWISLQDPLNDSAVAILKTSDKEGVLYQLWEEYQTDVDREESEKRGGSGLLYFHLFLFSRQDPNQEEGKIRVVPDCLHHVPRVPDLPDDHVAHYSPTLHQVQ